MSTAAGTQCDDLPNSPLRHLLNDSYQPSVDMTRSGARPRAISTINRCGGAFGRYLSLCAGARRRERGREAQPSEAGARRKKEPCRDRSILPSLFTYSFISRPCDVYAIRRETALVLCVAHAPEILHDPPSCATRTVCLPRAPSVRPVLTTESETLAGGAFNRPWE